LFIEDKNDKSEKNERSNNLKEFMKKKKKEKCIDKGNEDIIWMKGMEDILNLNIDSNISPEKNKNNHNRINSNNDTAHNSHNNDNSNKYKNLGNELSDYNNFENNNSNDNYQFENNNYEDLKEKEEYLNIHKMCIDLNNIEKEVENDANEINQEELKINDINSITRDFNIVSVKKILKFQFIFLRIMIIQVVT